MSTAVVDLTGSDGEEDLDPIGREAARRKAAQAELANAELVLPPGCKKPKVRHDQVPKPPTKSSKPGTEVFVLAKGDWPRSERAHLVNVKVLGTYSSRALAEAAMAAFLQRAADGRRGTATIRARRRGKQDRNLSIRSRRTSAINIYIGDGV